MRAQHRSKWYVGATSASPYCLFKSAIIPTNETHGCKFLFCFGPYRNEKRGRASRNVSDTRNTTYNSMKAQPENKTALSDASEVKYRKNSLEARLDELLPKGESYSVTFWELWREADGAWSVNDGWTPLREVSRESAIESLRDRWEIFKLNYLPKARVKDIQDIGYESNESQLEVDCTAFANVEIHNPIED